jgi:hypothetical protein
MTLTNALLIIIFVALVAILGKVNHLCVLTKYYSHNIQESIRDIKFILVDDQYDELKKRNTK